MTRGLNLVTCALPIVLAVLALSATAATAPQPAGPSATGGLHPNLEGQIGRPLRYYPEASDFVIHNGPEYFNRSLYGGNTAFRVDGGDKPEFVVYLPGRGGNLRLGIKTKALVKWLQDSDDIVARYRPGELVYSVRDKAIGTGSLTIEVLAYAQTEGLIVRVTGTNLPAGLSLIWAYGGVNGQRGARDGDIGTERVPISQYFQFQPDFAANNSFSLSGAGFKLTSPHATIVGVIPSGGKQHVADGTDWNNLAALLQPATAVPAKPVVVGEARLKSGQPTFLSLQRVGKEDARAPELDIYREVSAGKPKEAAPASRLPPFVAAELPARFAQAQTHFSNIRNRVRIETPDPYLNSAMGALNIVTDALWDEDANAIMHGSIAWRTKLLGWRGPYALDALGWHDRARRNFDTWLPNQNTGPIPAALPTADAAANLARNETGLHSNGDLSNSHYDMNMVFIDALFRHLLWTGDAKYARQVWPVIQRHLAWEQRLFRREYGPDKLPLYEAYATIWASDDLYYGGGGTSYASAYNVYANRMAARIARLAGEDPTPYATEADHIETAMRTLLWLPDKGTFAESKDLLGRQTVHDDYALWSFYHTIDERAVNPRESWQMGSALATHLKPIPIMGPGVPTDRSYHVLPESDWMPYNWSINNVVMDENMHTALALWQGGHPEDAFVLAKGAILASQYMGISPGNAGTMNYLDAYRRESQRDFGDSAGTMSRALVEGLFGIQPDALAGTLTVAPGFPSDWTHAKLTHPDVGLVFRRVARVDNWTVTQTGSRFKTIILRIPAVFSGVTSVTVNGGKASWRADSDAVGRPMLEIVTRGAPSVSVRILWSGAAVTPKALASAPHGTSDRDFEQKTLGAFSWWTPLAKATADVPTVSTPIDWRAAKPSASFDPIDLNATFNDQVGAIFAAGKYLSPRSPGVSLSLPSQGIGAWAGHVNLQPAIDDSGLRHASAAGGGKLVMPNGVPFVTPTVEDSRNIAFTSQWDNYPHEISLGLTGKASHIYLLMAGSTNAMQSHLDNGEVIIAYADGTTSRLALRNPETWWPIDQDYFIDDYQFRNDAPLPPRVDLKTGQIRLLDSAAFKGKGREVPGGAATVLNLPLDASKPLKSLTVRAMANDVVIGLMSATLERP
jgi:hypothetical protein